MPKLTTADLVNSIAQLGTQRYYDYPTGNTRIKITEITRPGGPIRFVRSSSRKPEVEPTPGSISTNKLVTAAAAFSKKPNYPIHFDRLFSGGGNDRAALEALLAHTPHFFICYPPKTNLYTNKTENTLKHIMWCPDNEHPLGEIAQKEYEQVVEVELDLDFGSIRITDEFLGDQFDTIETKRTHTQMQVALVEIGNALGFNTWIAKNDQSIQVRDTRLGNMSGVIQSLDDVPILYTPESKRAALLIDGIWFSDNFNRIPAVLEVEHSTGVTSGLTRMLKFKETLPSVNMTFTIVAPDDLRGKVVSEANNAVFRPLEARFMPYSKVQELYGFIRRYSLSSKAVNRDFIELFMENIVE